MSYLFNHIYSKSTPTYVIRKISFNNKRLGINIIFITINILFVIIIFLVTNNILFVTIFFLVTNIVYNSDKTKKNITIDILKN